MNQKNSKPVLFVLAALIITLIGSLFLLNLTPPFSRDALIHHLALPKLYLQHGGIYEIPQLVFSYYPGNLDLLYMGALYFHNDILPKYIHMAFGLATALLLFLYLKRRLSLTCALIGALFFLSVPIVIKLSTTAYVDLGLVFFTTAAVLLLFKWRENDFPLKHIILSGLCCGLAIGTKYNGLLVFFLLTCLIPFLYINTADNKKKSTLPAVKFAAVFCIFALLAASPWLIRNYIWTGNPVFPLYDSLFNTASTVTVSDADNANSIRGVFATRYVLYGENIWQLLALPIRIFWEGVDGDPRFFDGRLNPFLLILPIFAFLGISSQNSKYRSEIRIFIFFSILYFLFAFNTGSLRIRYLAPIVPFLVILSMYGLHNLSTRKLRFSLLNHTKTIILSLVIMCMLTYNGLYLARQFLTAEPLSYIQGKVSHDDYLAKRLPEFKVMQYANNHLNNTSIVLCIFLGYRGYYLDKKHIFDDHETVRGFMQWLKEPEITAVEIADRLANLHITNLMLRTDLFENWLRHENPHSYKIWLDFQKNHLLLLSGHLNYVLFEFVP